MTRNRALLALAVLVAFASVLASCKRPSSPEDRVRDTVREMARAVEAKDVGGVMDHVAEAYNDDYGNDYDTLKSLFFGQFMKPGSIRVFMPGLDVEVSGTVARVNAKVVVVRGADVADLKSLSGVVPEDAAAYEVSMIFRREGKDWLARGGNGQRLGFAGSCDGQGGNPPTRLHSRRHARQARHVAQGPRV